VQRARARAGSQGDNLSLVIIKRAEEPQPQTKSACAAR
jgi:hypothetical protein